MTVREHVLLYGALKGMTPTEVDRELDWYLRGFNFLHKRDCLVATLSGGQKRKLSVSLAFLGSASSIILLDEPTASVDPLSKRIIWDSIRAMRLGRSVIFTSHHLREAEFLSDRITILSHGRVCLSESTVALKAKYSQGYLLTFQKNHCLNEEVVRDGLNTITQLVSTIISQSVVMGESVNNLVIRLPPEGAIDGRYASLLEKLESLPLDNSPITHFTVTDTSMDDIVTSAHKDGTSIDTSDGSNSVANALLRFEPLTTVCKLKDDLLARWNLSCCCCSSSSRTSLSHPKIHVDHNPVTLVFRRLITHCRVIFQIRLLHLRRNRRAWLLEFFLPCSVLLFALILFTFYRPQIEQPRMDLHPWLTTTRRGRDQVTFVSHDTCAPESRLRRTLNLEAKMNGEHSWTGTRCLSRKLYSPLPASGSCRFTSPSSTWDPPNSNESSPTHCPVQSVTSLTVPPSRLLQSNDLMLNLTGYNISQYLLSVPLARECYGGLSLTDAQTSGLMNQSVVDFLTAIIQLSDLAVGAFNWTRLGWFVQQSTALVPPPMQQLRLWYNNKGHSSAPAYLNHLYNFLLRSTRDTTNGSLMGDEPVGAITVATFPIPFPKNDAWFANIREALKVEAAFALFLILAVTVIPANFAVLLVTERQSGVKQLLCVSGLQPRLYWLTHFLCDLLVYTLPVSLSLILLAVFNKTAYIQSAFLVLLLLYGAAMVPAIHLTSHLFQQPSTAYVLIVAVNIFISSVTLSVDVFLKILILQSNAEETRVVIGHVQRAMLFFFPHYCLGSTVFDLAMGEFVREHTLPTQLLRGFIWLSDQSAWTLLFPRMLCLLLQSCAFSALLLMVEYRVWRRMFVSVMRAIRVQNSCGGDGAKLHPDILENLSPDTHASTPLIEIRRLSKRYRGQSRPALDQLNLSVHPGECFGLLGTNGAGKSTTFSLLTGSFPVARKTIRLLGMDATANGRTTQPVRIGYCPQKNALHKFLTAQETLLLYGRLRGLCGLELYKTVDDLIISSGLSNYTHRQVYTYSDGTKRKLSSAIAFIGDPQIILLDEPSSGMDPNARRMLWAHVQSALSRQRAILLSSHCMEECESLCTRVGLLDKGRLQCVGSPSELKLRFSVGYMVDFTIPTSAINSHTFEQLEERLRESLPGLRLTHPLTGRQQFEYTQTKLLSQLFQGLQTVYTSGLIQHFSLKHSTLEDAFVKCIQNSSHLPSTT